MNELVELSSQETSEVSGIPRDRLDEWARTGVITPARGGGSQGKPRRYSFPQALGLAVAEQIRNSERGCVLSYVTLIVEAFQNVNTEWLEEQFEKAGSHFVLAHQGRPPLLDGEPRWSEHEWPNVEQTYHDLLKKIRKLRSHA